MTWNRRHVIVSGAALASWALTGAQRRLRESPMTADLILINGRFSTLDRANPSADAVAIADGKFLEVGFEGDIRRHAGAQTKIVDLRRARVIPGLIDSHMHIIRGGLSYNMELRWDGVRSLAVALEMLKAQVQRTPAPQWVRVVGGFGVPFV
jgi:predicted amidohydrolase YtcJ